MCFVNLQYILLLFNIATLFSAISHAVPFMDAQRKSTIQNRNFVQFGSLILGEIGNPLGYNGYGCWCGTGNRGNLVVDATDRCCQVHDKCWESLEKNIVGCKPFTCVYSCRKKPDKEIQCDNPVGTCEYGTCLCDKAAVECFARHRNTSYDPDFDNWEGICTETSATLQVDPEVCPPVWDDRQKYAKGTVVSVNGIKYQSLYSVGPGGNPKNNLYDSLYAGIVATWKKLKPCRRVNAGDKF